MNNLFFSFLAVLMGYALGAIPSGYMVLRFIKKEDITKIGSGRTGGTNAMRAGGFKLGLLTSLLDILKGWLAVIVAQALVGEEQTWVLILAGAASVFGHNWSIWLYLMAGKISAGAGTGPNIGAAMAFWPPIALVMVPVVAFFVLVVGYGSVASLVAALGLPIIFGLRYLSVDAPWEYIIYGCITTAFVAWALRPNIQRLLNGTERRVGLFAKKKE